MKKSFLLNFWCICRNTPMNLLFSARANLSGDVFFGDINIWRTKHREFFMASYWNDNKNNYFSRSKPESLAEWNFLDEPKIILYVNWGRRGGNVFTTLNLTVSIANTFKWVNDKQGCK